MNRKIELLVRQTQIAKIFLSYNHVLPAYNRAFSLTKRQYAPRGVTFITFFGQTKRTPNFEGRKFFFLSYLIEIS